MFNWREFFGLTESCERIYKVVYEKSGGYRQNTLIVSASSTAKAITKFYELAGSGVTNIVEFTEIKYDEGAVKNEEGE